jgi:hypothetical protein
MKCTTEKKVILVLKDHSTQSKNLEAITTVGKDGTLLLSYLATLHTGFQPLDVAIFKPFQTFYDAAISK